MAAIGTRNLTLTIDGDEVAPQVSTAVIKAAASDSDFVSFADAASGGSRQYTIGLTFVQDAAADSLWDRVWAAAGTTVPYLLRPYGNAVASPAQPHFSGNLIISEPDGDLLGGDADASPSARFTIEVEWACTAKPTRVTA